MWVAMRTLRERAEEADAQADTVAETIVTLGGRIHG